jgi:GNAT superfamily N-acetyltransferase
MTNNLGSNLGGLRFSRCDESKLQDYADLLANSFIDFQPSVEYLDWLYFQNPRGSVFGFDAYDGDLLVAHYACIPIKINAFRQNSLLSLNTATHPDYQGRGLFRLLANKTFESAAETFANV